MIFDFNFYSSLLLPSFFHSLIFSALLCLRGVREEKISDIIVSALLLLFGIKVAFWMLGFAGWYDSHDVYTMFMFYFPFNALILYGPLLYFYFLSITNSQFKWQKKYWYHLILPASWLLVILGKFAIDFCFYYPFVNIEATQYGTKGPLADLDQSVVFTVLSYASVLFYGFLILKKYKFYRQYLDSNFTNVDNIDLRWLRNMIVMVFIGLLVFFILSFVSQHYSGNSYKLEWFAYFLFGCIIYFVSISAFRYNANRTLKLNFVEAREEEQPKDNFENARMTKVNNLDDHQIRLKERLLEVINKEQLFLNPDLTLSDLSRKLETNNSNLSKIINDGLQQNFNDLINRYRVEYIKDKIAQGEAINKTLISLAYEAGFNSKATFNRAFKKITGNAPSEFLIR